MGVQVFRDDRREGRIGIAKIGALNKNRLKNRETALCIIHCTAPISGRPRQTVDPLDKDHGAHATFGAIQGECSLIFTCSRY